MTTDIIVLWAAMLGFAYLAGAGACYQLASAKRHPPRFSKLSFWP
ncbi:hypothetical protein [Mesorhizobium sp. B1-1-8]|nr:hypothetical protein [Mesorhizobium sp. B1-1-8]